LDDICCRSLQAVQYNSIHGWQQFSAVVVCTGNWLLHSARFESLFLIHFLLTFISRWFCRKLTCYAS
jgi:hypothetical protein